MEVIQRLVVTALRRESETEKRLHFICVYENPNFVYIAVARIICKNIYETCPHWCDSSTEDTSSQLVQSSE